MLTLQGIYRIWTKPGKCVFEIIANECDQKEDLPDVCKIALLKYYSDKEYTGELEDVLHQVLREMCEKQLVFPYYMNYKEEWLWEVQLYNKVMAAYRCKPGGKVRLYYKMKQKTGKNWDTGQRQ